MRLRLDEEMSCNSNEHIDAATTYPEAEADFSVALLTTVSNYCRKLNFPK